MADVRIYNRALSSNEVATLYEAERCPFTFTSNGTSVCITGYNGPGGAVTIPSTLKGLPVTAIAESAFAGQSNITSISIPDGVTYIGGDAFVGCTGLTTITLPDSVISIGMNAFAACPNLTNVSTSNGLKTFLSQYASELGLSAVAVNNFYSTTEGQLYSMVATSLAGNASFLSSLGTNSSFLGALSGEILATTNNYGLATKADLAGLALETAPTNSVYVRALATNTAFFSALATNPSFITTLSGQITGGSNSYGLATADSVKIQNAALSNSLIGVSNVLASSLSNQITGLSNTLNSSIASQTTGVSNALAATLSAQEIALSNAVSNTLIRVSGVSNALTATVARLSSDSNFVASLATNPVFLNALAARIVTSPNNLGLAVKLPQTLTFSPLPAVTYSSKKVTTIVLKAASSANLNTTTFTILNPSVGIINNANLIILGKGTTTVTATNSGNGIYTPASATQTLIVK